MYLPFNDMPDDSRIWIYQSNRGLSGAEESEIRNRTTMFIEEWTAHKQTLHASFELLHHIFLIIAVDENHNDASGCSVDKSVHFIQQLEKEFDISLMDRFSVAFKRKEKIELQTLKDFLKTYSQDNLTDAVPVFNNLIFRKSDLANNWEIPLRDSWIAKKV